MPANTPLAVQPLDADGKALQVMRSWFTAMPGEKLSCVGCHESQNSTPPPKRSLATLRAPSAIEPWYGPARGFSFQREVQPVLDKYCVGCHDGKQPSGGRPTIDLTARQGGGWRNFTPSYVALHPFVRRPGPESDYHLQKPLEFHADTSELVQMLNRGHYNVKLDAEAADRLVTWIDLNVPDHGTWHEQRRGHSGQEKRRLEMRTLYGNRPEDPEAIPEIKREPVAFVKPSPLPERKAPNIAVAGWPFDAAEAAKRQAAAGLPAKLQIELPAGGLLDLVLIPAGEFIMGDAAGEPDEYPPAKVRIDKPFYMAATEVTNAQYAAFDPRHNSEVISMTNKDHGDRGYPVNQPNQPVVRVTWHEAMAFCHWLSETDAKEGHAPQRGPMGMGLPRGHGHAVLLRRPGGRFRQVRQPGRFVARPYGPRRFAQVAPEGLALQRRGDGHYQRPPLPGKRLGAVRHARQRGRMDAQRLPALSVRRRRRPQRSAGRRTENRPRRLVVRPADSRPLLGASSLSPVAARLQRRLPRDCGGRVKIEFVVCRVGQGGGRLVGLD